MEHSANGTRRGVASAIKAAALVVVIGTLAAVWHPHDSGAVRGAADDAGSTSTTSAPDMSVYFPARFPAPEGPDELQAPTF